MIEYDVIIIGGGPAGLVASKVLLAFGKKVAIIEKNLLGGDCTHTGCIPSKALLKSAQAYYESKNLDKYGLKAKEFDIDTSNVMQYVRDIVSEVYSHETPEIFRKDGIDIIEGYAKFIAKDKVEVNQKIYKANKFIIATGSRAKAPQIEGIDEVKYLCNENIFLLLKIPKSMIIIGAGAIGVEMATAFNRLGCKITLVSNFKSILKQNDEELSEILLNQLIAEGIIFLNNAISKKVSQTNNIISLHLEINKQNKIIKAEKLFLATTRAANVELSLEKANVVYDKKSIQVNKYLQTSNKNIYAIGDVSTKYKFTHIAEQEAILAASNIALPFKKTIDYTNIAWCVYAVIEFAQIGIIHNDAVKQYGNKVEQYSFEYKNIDRGYTDNSKIGKIKVIILKNKIIGASILGSRAGELIHQLQLAKTFGISFDKLSQMIYIYPTYAELIKQTSKQFYIKKLYDNKIIKFIKFFKSMSGK